MKLTREFSAVAKNGKIVYNTGPVVPVPVKVKAVRLLLKDGLVGDEKQIQFSHNGDPILAATVAPGEWLSFEKPLRVSPGKQYFRVVAKPYANGDLFEGSIEIDLSVF